MTVKVLTAMQSTWAAMLLLVALMWFLAGQIGRGVLLGLLIAAYLYAIFALYRRRRWAWWCCLVPPILSLALAGPSVSYNLWLASHGHPLFSESPGTLIVVLVTAFFLVLPPIILLLRLLRIRKVVSPNYRLERPRQE